MRRGMWLAAAALVAAAMLVPTAAQADPGFYQGPPFGITMSPNGSLLVADSAQGVVNGDTGAVLASLPGINDVAAIGQAEMLAVATVGGGPDAEAQTAQASEETSGVYRITRGRVQLIADTGAFENAADPAGDGIDEGSNPFDLAVLGGHKALIADAAGNDLLVVDQQGKLDWVASFPTQNGIQPVPTSGVVGPDGAYYVGELTGFPFPTGLSRVWRIAPGTRHAHCGSSPACTVVLSGLTAIIDLQFGQGGKLYVAQIEDLGVGALEGGGGVGGSVHACNVKTGSCQTVVSGIPILTAITFRGSTLWGSILALVPGQADVVPLTP
jgi:hypothetical protein